MTTPENKFPYAELAKAEKRHFWFRARNRAISALAGRFIKDKGAGKSILEIGCGTGNVLSMLARTFPEATVTGMDLLEEGLVYARSRGLNKLVRGDASRPPFRPRFDMVCLFDVIEHIEDHVSALRNARSLLDDDGILLLTVPAHMALWSYFDESSNHLRRYSLSGLEETFVRAGLRIKYMSEFMMTLLPAAWLSRKLANRVHRGRIQSGECISVAVRDLKVWPVLNTIAELSLALEPLLIKHGSGIPFGASIIASAGRN